MTLEAGGRTGEAVGFAPDAVPAVEADDSGGRLIGAGGYVATGAADCGVATAVWEELLLAASNSAGVHSVNGGRFAGVLLRLSVISCPTSDGTFGPRRPGSRGNWSPTRTRSARRPNL